MNQALILLIGIRYSTRDLLSDLNNYTSHRDRPMRDMRQIRQMMSALSLASARLSKQ